MKKIIAGLFVLLAAPAVFAFTSPNGTLAIAYEGEGYSYREPHMQYPIHLKGRHQGVSVRYTMLEEESSSKSHTVVEGRFLTGHTDYDGYLMNGTPSTADHITDWYLELRGLQGYTLDINSSWHFTPYIGMGYRFLSNNMDEDDTGGYRRESTYVYVPIGFSLSTGANGMRVSLTGEFDWLLYGNQMSGLSRFGESDINNTQEKGLGARGGLKVELPIGTVAGIFVEPFYRFWKIQNSDVQRGYYEPFNISREYGIKAGIVF